MQVHREPLEFDREYAEHPCRVRDLAAGDRLHRLAERERVRGRGVTRHALDERHRLGDRPALEQLLDSLVGEEQLAFEGDDALAGDVEPEVPWLDDAGVDRPDGDLEDPFALDPSHRVGLTRASEPGVPGEVLPQRMCARRDVLVVNEAPAVRVAVGAMPNMSWAYRSYQWAAITCRVSDSYRGESAGRSVAISIHSCVWSSANTACTPNPRPSARSSVANRRSSGTPACVCRSAAILAKSERGTGAAMRPSAADGRSWSNPVIARSSSLALMGRP